MNRKYLSDSRLLNYRRKKLFNFLTDTEPFKEGFRFCFEEQKFSEIDRILHCVLFSFYAAKHDGQKSLAESLNGGQISHLAVQTEIERKKKGVQPASWFKTKWAYEIIQKLKNEYDVKSILDPFTGWGARACGALLNDVRYYGFDLNPLLVGELKDFYEGYLSDSFLFGLEDSLINYEKYLQYDYDAVFTCPPYWKAEDYGYRCRKNKYYEGFLNELEAMICSLMSKQNVKVAAICLEDFRYKGKKYNLVDDFQKRMLRKDFQFSKYVYTKNTRSYYGDVKENYCCLVKGM